MISGVAMKKVVFDPTVDIALRSLNPDGVRRVHAWFDYLKRWDEDEVVRKNSLPLPGHEGVYVLRTTTDIRIFFAIEDDTITVLDVAQKPAILTSGGIGIGGSADVSPISGGKKGR
jgi:mRNA-degrading endonuclease RelE of RelBE toxin-antitoxin system